MELENVLKILRKRWFYFIGTSLFIFIIFALFLFRQPATYQAYAKLLAVPERRFPTGATGSYKEDMPKMAEMMKFDTAWSIDTQLEIIKSLPVFRKAEKLTGITYGKQVTSCGPEKVGTSDIIILSCRGSDPEKVKDFANGLGTAYILYLQEFRVSETKGAREFVEKQIRDTEKDLERAEKKLRDFKESTGIVNLTQESAVKVTNHATFEANLENAKADLAAVRSKIQKAQEQLSRSEKELVSTTVISDNPILNQLKTRLADLEVDYAGMSKTHGKKHPKLMEVEAEIERTKLKLQGEMEKIISSQTKALNPIHTQILSDLTRFRVDELAFTSRRDALQTTIGSLEDALKNIPESEMELAQLERDKMVFTSLYTYLLQKYQDFKISEKTQTLPAKIIEKAEEAADVSRSKRLYSSILALIIACSLGLGVAFAIEYLDDAIYSVEDVKRYLDLKVLAQIPYDETIMKEPLITHHRPNSPVTESFRAMRNKLKYIVPDFHGKSFLVTSSIIEEGKSCIASNLAIIMAQYEMNVLLIDGDLRRPALHQYFNVENRGLTNILINNEEPESVIINTDVRGLDLICSGPLPLIETSPFNSSELLESKRMSKVMEHLKTKYDVIVIDSPPVLVLTDVLSLSLYASGILFVVDSGYVKRDDSIDAKSELELSSAPIFGALLNKSEGRSKGYYKYLYYYREETPKG